MRSPGAGRPIGISGGLPGGIYGMNDSATSLCAVLAENDRLRERLEAECAYLKAELGEARDFSEIVGGAPPSTRPWRRFAGSPTPARPSAPRGDRHRQGTGRPGHPHARPAARRPFHRGELRGHARRAHRERALRTREGRLHRREPVKPAASSSPTAARSSSTRSASSTSPFRRSSSASSKTG